jgi:hypothetical protein
LEQDAFLFQLATENDDPEQPQILSILREQKRLGTPYYDAPIPHWPYILRMEMNYAIDAEIEHTELQLANARLKARYASNDNPKEN